MKVSVKDIAFREDLYPRFEANQALIQNYANSTFGDPYYRISGGRTLDEFLEGARQKEYGNE
jgi:hypothetical protein